ncbi:MAG: response regulator [Anaerolineae bacterium]|nr:response regulator [Anaerolineae bacterium]
MTPTNNSNQSSRSNPSTQYPLRILLAEDGETNQKFALLALKRLGYQADVVVNGLEVLEAVLRQPYDVIFMDVQMPKLDGLEATRRIHKIWADKVIKDTHSSTSSRATNPPRPYIIAMTADTLQGKLENCLAAGMDDHLSKPIHLEELRMVLEQVKHNRGVIKANNLGTVQPRKSATSSDWRIQDLNIHIDQPVLDKLLTRPSGQKLLITYLNEASEVVSVIQRAVAEGDANMLREAAHNLKGSSSYMGVTGLANLSSKLEQQGREGQINDATETTDQLVETFEQVRQVLIEKLDS